MKKETRYELNERGKILAGALLAGLTAFAEEMKKMPVQPRKLTAKEKRKLR